MAQFLAESLVDVKSRAGVRVIRHRAADGSELEIAFDPAAVSEAAALEMLKLAVEAA